MKRLSADDIAMAYQNLVDTVFIPRMGARQEVFAAHEALKLGGQLQNNREIFRPAVDRLIDLACGCSTPESIDSAFAEADPQLLALVLDRLIFGKYLLNSMNDEEIQSLPWFGSATELVHRTLLQQFSGSA